MKTLWAVIFSLIAFTPVRAREFAVLDGDRQAVIVTDSAVAVDGVRADQDLAAYLQRATGRSFAVVTEADYEPARGQPIYVGRCGPARADLAAELAGLDADAYLISVTPERIVLAGPRPWSTYWAVCQFLEDRVGVRWLFPGPLGEDVPRVDRVVVPAGTRVYAPAFRSRLWSGAHHGGPWSLRQRIHERDRFHHNLLNIFAVAQYWDSHPEYFPAHDGRRYRPGGPEDNAWQPCMGTQATVQVAADAARAAFRADSTLESFSLGINDGDGWCTCPACRAIDRPAPAWHGFSGDKSVLYYSWLNQVAANLEADYPERRLGCLAYASAILPPPGVRLHRNIVPYFTSNRADYYEPAFRAQDEQMVSWWADHAAQFGLYDYAYGVGFAVPRLYSHLLQEALQFAHGHGATGFYAEVYPNWGLDGPKLYIMARLLWDPSLDVDRLAAEWSERLFREAAAPMARFFARCEQAWREQQTGPGNWAYRLAANPEQFKVFPPAVLAECTGYLDEAGTLARTDLVRQRVRFFRKTWELTRLLAGNYWAGQQAQALIERGAPMAEVAAAARTMAERLSSGDPGAYLERELAADPVAYFPPLPGWFEPLRGGALTGTVRWLANRLAADAVPVGRQGGRLDGPAVRARLAARIDTVLGGGGSPQVQALLATVRAMATKVGVAARVDTPIVLDGALDDAAWQRADLLSDFVTWGGTTAARAPTRVRVVHDGRDLYVALECVQPTQQLATRANLRDGSAWSDDSVEIFINPDTAATPYVQFIVNAAGAFYDRLQARPDQVYADALAWDGKATWATRVEPDRWLAELRLPLADLGVDLQAGAPLRMNFVRNVASGQPEISAWFSSVAAHADPLSRGWILAE